MATTTRISFERLEPVALVAVGGFGGAVARYSLALVLPTAFPWGTLAVNVVGSFALAMLLYEARFLAELGEKARLLAGTGFLSSFTTYSTFAAETAALSPRLAVLNVGANYGFGVLAVLAGRELVRRGVS